jgi:hypothetical protein
MTPWFLVHFVLSFLDGLKMEDFSRDPEVVAAAKADPLVHYYECVQSNNDIANCSKEFYFLNLLIPV